MVPTRTPQNKNRVKGRTLLNCRYPHVNSQSKIQGKKTPTHTYPHGRGTLETCGARQLGAKTSSPPRARHTVSRHTMARRLAVPYSLQT